MITAIEDTVCAAAHGKTGPGGRVDLQRLPGPVEFTMPTPPSTNTLYRNVRGKGRVKTAAYHDFIAMGIAAIRGQRVQPIAGNVLAVFGVERMSKSADIDNRLKAMLDTIVKAGVIEDDRFVTAIAISWLPKANGLSWVRILPEQETTITFHPSPEGACGGWFQSAPQPQE